MWRSAIILEELLESREHLHNMSAYYCSEVSVGKLPHPDISHEEADAAWQFKLEHLAT